MPSHLKPSGGPRDPQLNQIVWMSFSAIQIQYKFKSSKLILYTFYFYLSYCLSSRYFPFPPRNILIRKIHGKIIHPIPRAPPYSTEGNKNGGGNAPIPRAPPNSTEGGKMHPIPRAPPNSTEGKKCTQYHGRHIPFFPSCCWGVAPVVLVGVYVFRIFYVYNYKYKERKSWYW
jgi:hypothetical protein